MLTRLPAAFGLLLAPDLLERLSRRFSNLLFVLLNDTTGVEERWRLAPVLLGAWLVGTLVASPVAHGLARLLGSSAELRKSAGTALWIAAVQVGFFALHWLVIAWGDRRLDWSVFGAATVAAALVAKWGHEIDYWKCLLLVLLQSAAVAGLLFLASFAAAELGLA